jgi:hypothetical protein
MALAGETGTIFDNPWFTFERPAFEKIAGWSDTALTFALVLVALVVLWVALSDRSTLTKAVVLAWICLP